jgi:hypothetical protein
MTTLLGVEAFSYTGWFRPHAGCSWQAVCQADSNDSAWDKLLALPWSGDRCVLASSQRPGRSSASFFKRRIGGRRR